MKFQIKRLGTLIMPLIICSIPLSIYAETNAGQRLAQIEQKMKKESRALNSIIQKVYPDHSTQTETSVITKLKMSSSQCRVRETIARSSQSLYSPTINEEFSIVEHDDNYYHINLGDGRDGWIHESCGQVIRETVANVKKSNALQNNDVGKYLDFAEVIYEKMSENKLAADKIVSDNKIDQSNNSYRNINKYHSKAMDVYATYLHNRAAYVVDNFGLSNRISGSAELLLGKSNHNQTFLDKTETDYDESNRNFSLNGNYLISEDMQVNLSLDNRTEVLQTPYKTKNYGVGFDYTGLEKIKFNTHLNFNSYVDEFLSDNDYGRVQFNATARHRLSEKTNFVYNYTFLNNNYDKDDGRDYSNQRLSAIANFPTSDQSKMILSLLTNFENSDSEFHKFKGFYPSLSFQRKNNEKRSDLRFRFDNVTFDDLELRDYNRLVLSYLVNKKQPGKRKFRSIALSNKAFPNNDISDYYQIKGKIGSSTTGIKNKRKTLSTFTNIYPNADKNNFSDFRFDYSASNVTAINLSAYYRLWHDIFDGDSDSTSTSKPSILDLSGKFGFQFGSINIGPTIGLHALLDFDNDKVIEQDGNLFRFGAVGEGVFKLPKHINVSFMLAYDYSFVYNEELTIDQSTGNINQGELQERHPVTLQFNSTISAPLMQNLELIGRVNYYKIDTDLDADISINPIEFAKQMSFQIGIRYLYN